MSAFEFFEKYEECHEFRANGGHVTSDHRRDMIDFAAAYASSRMESLAQEAERRNREIASTECAPNQVSSGLAANERKEDTGSPHGSAFSERDGLRTESEQSLGSANVATSMRSPENATRASRPLEVEIDKLRARLSAIEDKLRDRERLALEIDEAIIEWGKDDTPGDRESLAVADAVRVYVLAKLESQKGRESTDR